MKKYNLVIFTTLLSIVLLSWACTKIELSPNKNDKAVLQGYLYAYQPVTEIQITRIVPRESEDSVSLPITDAEVFISVDNKKYQLSHNPQRKGFYRYEGTDLQIIPNKKYKIEFDYFGRTTSAETTVPSAPQNISISPTTVYAYKVNSINDLFNNNSSLEEIKITWSNPGQEYFYIVIDNLEDAPQKIVADGVLPDFGNRNFNFISQPTRSNEYLIRPMQLEQFGRHRVKLYKINKEYADLYNTQQQDSRNLNEPLTNVHNGLGIFTSFNMDSVFFEVRRR